MRRVDAGLEREDPDRDVRQPANLQKMGQLLAHHVAASDLPPQDRLVEDEGHRWRAWGAEELLPLHPHLDPASDILGADPEYTRMTSAA